MRVRVVIPGEPVPQGRGKAGRWRSKDGREGTTVRDPSASRNWKATAQVLMLEAMREAELAPLEGPLRVRLVAVFSLPRSRWRKSSRRPREWCLKKRADVDNLAKAALDAGNGVLYLDDSQVVALEVEKWIGAQGEPSYVEVTLEEAEKKEAGR